MKQVHQNAILLNLLFVFLCSKCISTTLTSALFESLLHAAAICCHGIFSFHCSH